MCVAAQTLAKHPYREFWICPRYALRPVRMRLSDQAMGFRLAATLLSLCFCTSAAWGGGIDVHAAADQQAVLRVSERYGLRGFSAPEVAQSPDRHGVLLNEPSPVRDKAGLRSDTRYFLTYQIAVIGVLYVMPESMSGWSEEQKSQRRLEIWWDNVKNPEWDNDDLFINYALHPYWGATYFVRAKERGFNNGEALRYSLLLSTLYEFGVEAIFENPSIQDFFVTPIGGYYLGKYFESVREDIRAEVRHTGILSRRQKLVLALTDPLGSMNRYVRLKLGGQAEFDLRLKRLSQHDQAVGAEFVLRF